MPTDVNTTILQALIELLIRSNTMSDSIAQIRAALASASQDAADANQRVVTHLALLQSQNDSLAAVEQQLKDQISTLQASQTDTSALTDILSQVQTLRSGVQAIDKTPPAPPAPLPPATPDPSTPVAAAASTDGADTSGVVGSDPLAGPSPAQGPVPTGTAPSVAQAPNNAPLV